MPSVQKVKSRYWGVEAPAGGVGCRCDRTLDWTIKIHQKVIVSYQKTLNDIKRPHDYPVVNTVYRIGLSKRWEWYCIWPKINCKILTFETFCLNYVFGFPWVPHGSPPAQPVYNYLQLSPHPIQPLFQKGAQLSPRPTQPLLNSAVFLPNSVGLSFAKFAIEPLIWTKSLED
jgi:hypothetical protein